MPDPRNVPPNASPDVPPNRAGGPSDPTVGAKLAFAWLFVGIPAAWGVWQVFVKSLALFK